MPISPIVLQRRQAELGRIRLGQKNPDKGFPMKLDRFRFTSVSEQYVCDLADLYGGTPQPWDNNGIPSWEVITDATSIPVIVVKGGLSQWMEFWAGGGCLHRCDGVTNMLTGDLCDTTEMVQVGKKKLNPHNESKPTTRLSVMLPELEAIGVFRMESHGWNAAAEIPAVAELAQFVGDLVPAVLHLVERRTIKDGKTSRFVVPVLDLQIGAAKLREVVAAKSGIGEVNATSSVGELESSAEKPDYAAEITAAADVDELRKIWEKASDAGHLTGELRGLFKTAFERLDKISSLESGIKDQDIAEPVPAPVIVDDVWQQVLTVAGSLGMDLWQIETDYAESHGGALAEEASGEELETYLEDLRGRTEGAA